MSTQLYQSKCEDIYIGDGFAIICIGSRRFQFDNLDVEQAEWLKHLVRGPTVLPHGSKFVQKLLQMQAIGDHSPGPSSVSVLRLSSRYVTALAAPLRCLTSSAGLLILTGVTAALLFSGLAPLSHTIRLMTFAWNISLPTFAAISLVFAVCAAIHELGHSTACLRLTGVAGAIRIKTYRGLPAMAADVSSVHRTSKMGRSMIAASGAVFQAAFATVLLFLPVEAVRIGATAAILSALFSIFPLPKADGYWLLRDALDITLNPRLTPGRNTGDLINFTYGCFLVILTLTLGILLSREAIVLALSVVSHLGRSHVLRCVIVLAFSVYIAVVAVFFVRTNLKLIAWNPHDPPPKKWRG